MKKSSIVIIISFVVGISIISALAIMNPPKNTTGTQISFTDEKSRLQYYWEDYVRSNPEAIIIEERREVKETIIAMGEPSIEIHGLKTEYSKKEPINFEVLVIGDGSGCASTWISILTEDETQPPIYSQEFVSICDGSHLKYLAVPISFSINTEESTIPHLDSGKYVVSASYYQDRGSSGDIKREFIIK
jgi:hypothetical protein